MDNNIKTISDLVNSISAEMEQLDYKPSVLKQYHIVWDKLCTYAGERSIQVFNISFGMDFLEEVAGIPLPIVSEWLGHSNMETTLIYAQASIEMKRKAAEKLKGHESSVFKGDAAFKYDDETIKKLSGLK